MPKDKLKTIYVCNQCGETSPRWMGRCPSCGEIVPPDAISCPHCYTFLYRKPASAVPDRADVDKEHAHIMANA